MPPKPSGPPENANAALTGHQDGAKQIGKKLAASGLENYSPTPEPSTCDDHQAKDIRAKHLEIRLRYAWDAREKKRRGRPTLMMKVRLRELERLFYSRWGATLPDDDAGRDDLKVAVHHIAAVYRNPGEHIPAWVGQWAPWLSDAECAALVATATANPLKWTADKLAWRMRLTDAERTALKITTIGAIDCGKAARAKRRLQRNSAAKRERRREGGALSRTEYENASASRARPWEVLGMSRATWYRKGKPGVSQQSQPTEIDQPVRQVRVQQSERYMLSPHMSHDGDRTGSQRQKQGLNEYGSQSSTDPEPAAARRERARPFRHCGLAMEKQAASLKRTRDLVLEKNRGDMFERELVPFVPPSLSLPCPPAIAAAHPSVRATDCRRRPEPARKTAGPCSCQTTRGRCARKLPSVSSEK